MLSDYICEAKYGHVDITAAEIGDDDSQIRHSSDSPVSVRFAYETWPLALSSMACVGGGDAGTVLSRSPSYPPCPDGQCRTRRRACPTPGHASSSSSSLLSCTYTIGTASTRDTAYLVHFCWLTVSPSGVSESTSRRGRASARARSPRTSRLDRVRENRSRRGTHTLIRGVPKPPNILLRPLLAAHAEIIISS